jgi:hypothetical protein
VDNIPTPLKQGWDFALWYTWVYAIGKDSGSDFLKSDRVVALDLKGQAWDQAGALQIRNKIEALIRRASKLNCERIALPSQWIKPLGAIQAKVVGRKPVPGLYTELELKLAQNDWDRRNHEVRIAFNAINDLVVWPKPPKAILDMLQNMVIRPLPEIKGVENALQKRIPPLVVRTGKGRTMKEVIVKGGSLTDKLKAAPGVTAREAAKILWSPLMRCAQGQFVETLIMSAREMTRSGCDNNEAVEHYLATLAKKSDITQLASAYADLVVCVGFLVEIHEEHFGSPGWAQLSSQQ